MPKDPHLDAWERAGARDGFRVSVDPFGPTHSDPIKRDPADWSPYVADYGTRIGDWGISGLLQVVDGRLALGSMNIGHAAYARNPDGSRRDRQPEEWPLGGVTTSVLRELPLGRILDQARLAWIAEPIVAAIIAAEPIINSVVAGEEIPPLSTEAIQHSVDAAVATAEDLAGRVPLPRRPGRPGLSDEHYRRLAGQYLELQASGRTRGLLDELGQRQSPPKTRDTMRDQVRRAAALGFLGPAVPGRGGRSPGPRLLEGDQS